MRVHPRFNVRKSPAKKAKKNSIDEAKKSHLAASVKGSWYNQPQPTPQPSTSNETGKEIGASILKIIAFDFGSPDFFFFFFHYNHVQTNAMAADRAANNFSLNSRLFCNSLQGRLYVKFSLVGGMAVFTPALTRCENY